MDNKICLEYFLLSLVSFLSSFDIKGKNKEGEINFEK